LFKYPPHPTSDLALAGENRSSKPCVEMNEKKLQSILSIQISGPQQV